MKISPILAAVTALVSLSLPACDRTHAEEHESPKEQHKIVVTTPRVQNVTVTQPYVCQIRSQRNIEVCALQDGYLEAIPVKEGQAVKQGDVMFRIVPTLYKARLDAEVAEAKLAQIEFDNTKRLFDDPKQPVVSFQEVALAQAKLDKANAKAKLAAAEVDFTVIRAPFDGIVDRLQKQQGSLIERKDVLTTLSDNSVMWVYFNVPEARYFEYKARQGHVKRQGNAQIELVNSRIELALADASKFKYDAGNVVTVEGKFNNETGNIPFRADFPNPDGLLLHGQTGTVLIHRQLHDAVVIPQRAVYEILDKQYVYVVDEHNVAHQRPITVQYEQDDIFVIKNGLDAKDRIILEGFRMGLDGKKVETEFRNPEDALKNLKQHAE